MTENKRPELHFTRDGKFRILMMSDIQESANYNPRSLASVRTLLDTAEPDFVMLGGDNCYGPKIHSLSDLDEFLEVFAGEIERRGIPWAHIFGNHDHDVPCDMADAEALYERYPHCLSRHDDRLHGVTNYVLPVLDRHGRPRFNIWALDTNNIVRDQNGLVPSGDMRTEALLPNNPLAVGEWGFLYFDQLSWYYNTSLKFEEEEGAKVPGILCMHVAPHEFKMATANPDRCVKSGHYGEVLSTSPLNSGIFSAVLQRGDVRTIACGHTHENDAVAEFCGITLCWDACAGYGCYGCDDRRGGRVFDISEDDPWNIKTHMIYTLDAVNAAEGT